MVDSSGSSWRAFSPADYWQWYLGNIPEGVQPFECWCGCGGAPTIPKETSRKGGRFKDMPMRFVHGHNSWLLGNTYCVEEDRGFETLCWIWQGDKDSYGHGYCRVGSEGGRRFKAHRVYYAERYGEIPPGMLIHHRCEVPDCCRPEHLQAVDGNKGHKLYHPSSRILNNEQIAEVRRLYATGNFTQKGLGKMFNVSQPVIWHIVNRHGSYADC